MARTVQRRRRRVATTALRDDDDDDDDDGETACDRGRRVKRVDMRERAKDGKTKTTTTTTTTRTVGKETTRTTKAKQAKANDENDDENDDDDVDDDDDDDGSSENEEEIMVDFDFCDAKEEDFHGLKALLTGYLDSAEYACSDLCDCIIKQKGVGTVVKTSDDDADPLGVTTVISLSLHKDENFVKDIKKYLLNKCPSKDKKAFEAIVNDIGTGLIINERIINVPQETGQPLMDGLFEEIRCAAKDAETAEARKSYEFKNYVLIGTLYEEDGEAEAPKDGKKRKKEQASMQRIFPRLEEEIMLESAKMSFEWQSSNESNEVAEFRPRRCCMVVEAKRVADFLKEIQSLFEEL